MLAVLALTGCAGTAPAAAPGPAPAAPVATAGATTSGAAPADRLAVPARVRLAGIDADAAVVPVGVDDRGEMEVPEDVDTVGWYRFGPGPGSGAGSAVLSGHVDDRVQGRGAFYSLTDLAEGDPVQVDLADGTTLDYRVTRVERIDKSVLPVDRLFARAGAPHLTLVTCGGAFDRATRNYRDNVVVTAAPVG
jgi:LPXTG-site transpeptidase (sortase) family protein